MKITKRRAAFILLWAIALAGLAGLAALAAGPTRDEYQSVRFLKDAIFKAATKTTAGVGAKSGSTVTAVEYGEGNIHKTVLTLTALPLTLRNTEQGLGVKIYDFPAGRILFLGATGTVAETTTSAILTTLNGGKTYNWGVGSTTQANGTLATTEQDIVQTTNGTSSATINVAGAASNGVGVLTPLDGTSSAIDAFFNVGLATGDDIDGDATTTYTGTITITWMNLGDY